MKTITLSGIIEFNYSGSWPTIKLIQDDGYKIDLVNRIKEASESLGENIQVSYYVSDNACTINEMREEWLKKISGAVNASYEANEYHYSSWTSGVDYDTTLKIGKHDLFSELRGLNGKFIIINMKFSNV